MGSHGPEDRAWGGNGRERALFMGNRVLSHGTPHWTEPGGVPALACCALSTSLTNLIPRLP